MLIHHRTCTYDTMEDRTATLGNPLEQEALRARGCDCPAAEPADETAAAPSSDGDPATGAEAEAPGTADEAAKRALAKLLTPETLSPDSLGAVACDRPILPSSQSREGEQFGGAGRRVAELPCRAGRAALCGNAPAACGRCLGVLAVTRACRRAGEGVTWNRAWHVKAC